MYQYLFTPPFKDSVEAFARRPQVNAALMETLTLLAADPFDSPVLQTHRVERAQGETFTSRVGKGGHRLIWRRVGRTIVLLLFGEHDPVYRRAERLRLEVDVATDAVRIVDADPATHKALPYRERRAGEGRLFMAWNDEELAGFGFAPQEVAVLRALDTDDQLLELEPRMAARSFERAYNLVAHGSPELPLEPALAADAAAPPLDAVMAPPADDSERALEERLRGNASREEFAPVAVDALAGVLGRPIEDWMVFLHPDQARLTERSFSGPARIRGGAGTGKTVVALHRARHLARRGEGRILFTTFVNNLPPVFGRLFARLAPEAAHQVEFVNLHRWAFAYLRRSGRPPKLDAQAIEAAYNAAWAATATGGNYLAEHGYPRSYYREEIDWVVKGRGLATLDAYLALERTGRGTALGERHRRAVWELYEAYQRNLRHKGLVDFNDVLLEALQRVQAERPDDYRSVIVDEAQDLTEVGVRLLHALVGDRPDGLLLVGDLAQSVYPGGYNLRDAGIDVVGRSGLLRVNYRSTRRIVEAAIQLAAAAQGPGGAMPGPGATECLREGERVRVHVFDSADDHDQALALALDAAAGAPGVDAGDLAVLLPTNRQVDDYRRRIAGLGLRLQELRAYDGTPTAAVKVGTYQRAKGLEFKQVFLPRLETSALGEHPRHGEDEETYRERVALLRRQLFVALTRARDHAWLGAVKTPSSLVGGLLT